MKDLCATRPIIDLALTANIKLKLKFWIVEGFGIYLVTEEALAWAMAMEELAAEIRVACANKQSLL